MTNFTLVPWLVYVSRDQMSGSSGFRISEHTHRLVCINPDDYHDEGFGLPPEQDEDGYCLPNKCTDIGHHNLLNAHLISFAPEMFATLQKLAGRSLEARKLVAEIQNALDSVDSMQ